ncbi:sigma-54 dependent transcriptional regulator [Deferribacterales bacterium Es71-Z0220]|uniref:sigma-54-dependent transcriptional regulator n=1 Tax=Deferrivibrio essentukiensis TaxID=2880922 RepID=UPI001F60139C|nr:sigma-54 dependent transcriptional regulator [Deferrivibrio essentukiensis]MCB4203868.1 sigma-54 dependent transcriptional regulator [Deferrivibrio essentukiensis]
MADKRNILIVDDDDNMQSALLETVKRLGFDVDTASDGSEGFDMAMKKTYDLIISDIRMPKVDGLKMYEMLKSAGIHTPICFITAYGTVDNAIKALKEGAFDFIIKPFPLNVIEEMISRVFEIQEVKHSKKEGEVNLIFKSKFMEEVFNIAKDIAPTEATVLITGESGTGKEVVAKFIHENSKRKGQFIAINCAAIPESLIESELFGYEKGAFTGAINKKPGKFELADGGTLLLDEIGEVPLNLQAKLLRVLQEKEIERLGSTTKQKINVRIIATTNRNLKDEVEKGNFREDLYYRLNVINIELPPLRKRKEDIMAMTSFFIKKYSEINSKPLKELSQETVNHLLNYDWPGNVRELEHTIERAVILSKEKYITPRDLFLHGITFNDTLSSEQKIQSITYENNIHEEHDNIKLEAGVTISQMEQELILKTLREVDGNRTKAAELLGITVRTLRNKLNEYREKGIDLTGID